MKKTLLITLFFIGLASYAQNVKVEGTIKDSIGNPLELANVIAFVKGSNKVESYSITNDKGRFRLVLPTNETYNFRVSYIGFETQNLDITIPDGSSDIARDFTLKEEDNTLNEVELTFEMPVTIKGDTIVYNADSFTNGTEKKLEDILKKLPGVEITDDGQIEVEGKRVSKVMVEGKDFFDGDSKIASKNIPSNAVDKIEVLRNYNEVGPMRGMGDDSDNIAINIKLKQGKKNFWFGEITAGVGTDDGYLLHPKLFYYSPKTSVNIITDFNNVGEIPFTQSDYRRFSGGFRNMMRRGGTSFNVGNGGLGFSAMQNNRAEEIISKFGAVNVSYSPKKALTLSGFAIANESEIDMFSKTVIRDDVTEKVEFRENTTQQKSKLGMLKMSANYVPNANTHFDYDVLMKTSKQEEYGLVASIVEGSNEDIIDNQEQNPTSINQNLSYFKVLGNNDVISFEAQHLYQEENPLLNFLRDQQPFDDIIPTEPEVITDLSQQKDTRTNKFDAKFDYYLVLNNKSNLDFTLGTTLSYQNFDSNIFQILDNGSQLDFNDEELVNDVTYQFNDIFLGIHYKAVAGKFTFTPGFTTHAYKTKDVQLGNTNSNSDVEIVPDLLIQWKLKQSQNLRFNYSMTRQYTDIERLSESYVLSNFNSMYFGNRNLESALYNRFNLNFFSFSMFNFTNMNASVTYSKKANDIKNISDPHGFNQTIRTSYNSNLADETLSGNARYGRRFGKFKVNASMNLNYSKNNNIDRNKLNVSESFTQNYRASFATNFKTAPNLEIGYAKTFNQYESSFSNSDFTTDRPFAKFETFFLKDFSLVVDYSYYNYRNENNSIENTYSFLDASLYYQKKDSKWEFIVSGKNLTDNESINSDNFTGNKTRATSYYVMPLRMLFSIKYNL